MSWTRRLFVRNALKGWLGLVIAPSMYGAFRFLTQSRASGVVQPTDIGCLNDFKPGTSKIVGFGEGRIIVTRNLIGDFNAVSAVCTHLGCSIRFDPKQSGGETLECNCHNSRFGLDGENLSGPATQRLKRFPVDIVAGRVIIGVAEKG
jgi:Rieske Fe-S protein